MIIVTDKRGKKIEELKTDFVFKQNSRFALRICKNCKRAFIIASAPAGRQKKGGSQQKRVSFCPICRPFSLEKLTKQELIKLIRDKFTKVVE